MPRWSAGIATTSRIEIIYDVKLQVTVAADDFARRILTAQVFRPKAAV
jgi:hypothetical protein